MSFTGKEGAPITVKEAQAMINRYRVKYATKEDSEKPSNTIWAFSGREIIQKILDQEGCVGIRFYFAEQDGHQDIVMVGVDQNENDLVKGVIADRSKVCPPSCGAASPTELLSNVATE